MKIHPIKLLPAIILFCAGMAGTAHGEGPLRPEAVVLHADNLTHEQSDNTYRAIGNVHLEWDGMKLVADRAFLKQTENTAEAEGSIVLTTDGDRLTADRMVLDLESRKGKIENGYLFMEKGNFHLWGDRMEKTGEEDYHIEKGVFTLCDGETPSWKFSASSVQVSLGEYATGKNVLFYIRNTPVFYLPYVVFPVKRERQSGFLLPKFGTSTKKGINFNIPYYWAISPSQDATFHLDIQSKRGVGTEANYRYIRKTGSEGDFRGYLIYDTRLNRLRGDLSEKHQEIFSPTLVFKSDINYVSDRDFYRDYAEAFGEYNRKSVDSNVFLTKHWQRFLLTPELRFTQDLEATSNVATFQKLPVITFSGITQKVANLPVYFALDSNFTNFYRLEGFQGQRLDLHPALLYYLKPGDWLEGAARVGYQHRLYNMYGGTGGNNLNDAGLLDAGLRFSSTVARVYDTGWNNLQKVRHTLIPELGYTYVQSANQDSLPFFDFNDRVVHQNTINYSITNYLTGKFMSGDAPASYRDLAYVRLSQGYDLSGSRRDLLTLFDELHPFTDVRIEAKVNPTREVSFLTDSRYNPYKTNFSTTSFAVRYDDSQGNLLSAGYRFARTQLEYLEGSIGLRLIKPLIFSFSGRYSIDKGDFLESYYAVEYKQQCWSVILSYGERQGNKEFFVNFALAGIGPLGRIKAF